jgi:hypothetical protein
MAAEECFGTLGSDEECVARCSLAELVKVATEKGGRWDITYKLLRKQSSVLNCSDNQHNYETMALADVREPMTDWETSALATLRGIPTDIFPEFLWDQTP